MSPNGLDPRFCQAALDALKSFPRVEFTVRFMDKHKLRPKGSREEMWAVIQEWLSGGDTGRCRTLLEYTDDLKMWGRQRVFLFDMNGHRQELMRQLSNPDEVRTLVGDVYDHPKFQWKAPTPFLAEAKHTTDRYTDDPLLVLKLIDMRKFDLVVDDRLETYEERSTNFFIVNLRHGFAELRLQQLPTGAHRNLRQERELIEEEIKRHLGDAFEGFSPIQMEPVMREILRGPIYTVTGVTFKTGKGIVPGMSTLEIVLTSVFQKAIPRYLAAFWKCKQDVLRGRPLHFTLHGGTDDVAFDGLADPYRIHDILKKIVDLSREGSKVKDGGRPWKQGWVNDPYMSLEGHPKAQAVLLAAGAIAASMIWIIIDGVGNYLLEGWVERLLRGVPLVVIQILVDVLWIWRYYGSDRIRRSFKALWNMPLSKIWETIRRVQKGGEAALQVGDDEAARRELAEPQDND